MRKRGKEEIVREMVCVSRAALSVVLSVPDTCLGWVGICSFAGLEKSSSLGNWPGSHPQHHLYTTSTMTTQYNMYNVHVHCTYTLDRFPHSIYCPIASSNSHTHNHTLFHVPMQGSQYQRLTSRSKPGHTFFCVQIKCIMGSGRWCGERGRRDWRGWPCIYTCVYVLIREVSLFQGLKSTQTWNLGKKRVSCLERCPYRLYILTCPCEYQTSLCVRVLEGGRLQRWLYSGRWCGERGRWGWRGWPRG